MGPERIVLIGLRRAGKTTVGRLLATRLAWPLIDTDEVIEQTTCRTPADWISGSGVAAFRDAEAAAVATLADVRRAVIATGGGAPLAAASRGILRQGSLVTYLRVDPWILGERARSDPRQASRPLLAGSTSAEEPFVLSVERDAVYRGFCDIMVDGARSAGEVAETILAVFHGRRKPVAP